MHSGRIDVWSVNLRTADADERLLAHPERLRARRFKDAAARQRFVQTRTALRCVLGRSTGRAPSQIRFSEAAGCKPRLHPPAAALDFNVTHTDGLALIAIADRPVGVDVEAKTGALDPGIAQVICSTAELEHLGECDPVDRATALLRLWTRKEAALKADGRGFRCEPRLVDVRAAVVAGLPGALRVRDLRVGAGYVGAVCAPGADWTVHLHAFEPA